MYPLFGYDVADQLLVPGLILPGQHHRLAHFYLAQQGRFAEITEDQFPLLVHRSRHGDVALKAQVRAMNEETGPEAYCRQQHAIIGRADSRPGLVAIACPTLVLVGDDDQLTPPVLAHEMAAGIRGARLVVVPECGHLSTMERPQAVTQALLDWMRW